MATPACIPEVKMLSVTGLSYTDSDTYMPDGEVYTVRTRGRSVRIWRTTVTLTSMLTTWRAPQTRMKITSRKRTWK